MSLKRVCIYGAGAIGGWLGVALAKAGCELSAVARGQTLAALQHNGLTLVHGEERETVAVNAQQDPAALGMQDVVVIAVKAPSMPDVARAVTPLIGPQTLVLTAMNGVPW